MALTRASLRSSAVLPTLNAAESSSASSATWFLRMAASSLAIKEAHCCGDDDVVSRMKVALIASLRSVHVSSPLVFVNVTWSLTNV